MPPKKKPKKKVGKKKKRDAKKPIVHPPDRKLPIMPDARNATMLQTLATSDVQSLGRLISHYNFGNVLNTVDMNGSTPIHIAVKKNDLKMLQNLISYNKININALELHIVGGYSALHHACMSRYPQIVQILLQFGADPNIKCDSSVGETPLQCCCRIGDIPIASKLLQNGASPDIKDNFGNNASFWAYKNHHENLIRELGLPPMKAPNADEFLAILKKNNPNFTLPTIKKPKKGKKGKDGKKKK